MLAVTYFEATISFFNITDENNSFSILTPSHWFSQNAEETINKLITLMDLRSENDLDLHINEVKRRGNSIILDGQEFTYYILSDKTKDDFFKIM